MDFPFAVESDFSEVAAFLDFPLEDLEELDFAARLNMVPASIVTAIVVQNGLRHGCLVREENEVFITI